MPETTISLAHLRDTRQDVRAHVEEALLFAGFDLTRPFHSLEDPRERCVRYWQEEAAPNEHELMRRAYREMMGDPAIQAARDLAERQLRAQMEQALQDVVSRVAAEHFPGMPVPTVNFGPSDLRAAYRHWWFLGQAREAQRRQRRRSLPEPAAGATIEPLNVPPGESDFVRIQRELEDAILRGLVGAPAPEEPLTTDSLRELLGGDVPPARFSAEGGWRPSEN